MLAFASVYVLLTITALFVATITDIKKRLVSNSLVYSFAAIGLLLRGAESYFAGNLGPLEASIIAGAIGFVVSYALYRMGVWAGGDVKLVTAIAFANPINYAALSWLNPIHGFAFNTISLPIFAISLIFLSALMVFPLGITMSLAAALGHRDILAKTVNALSKKALSIFGVAILVSGSRIFLGWFFSGSGIIAANEFPQNIVDGVSFALLLIVALLPKKAGKIISAAFGLAGLVILPLEFIAASLAVSVPIFAAYALWKIYAESREIAFKQIIPTKKIEEGMIPDSFIVERNGRIELVAGQTIKTVINQLINNKLAGSIMKENKITGKILAAPMDAGGISQEAAERLREMAKKGKAPKNITVKKTMAFVPAILAAYIVLQIGGDILWNIFFRAIG